MDRGRLSPCYDHIPRVKTNMSDYSFETLISRMAISILPQQNNPPSNLRFIQTHKHPTQHHLHLLITPTPISDSTPHLLSQIPLQDPSPRPFSNTLLHPPLQTQTFTNWKTRPVAPSPQRNVRVQTLGSSLEKITIPRFYLFMLLVNVRTRLICRFYICHASTEYADSIEL